MGNLIVNQNMITPELAQKLIKVCPFGAISYDDNKLSITSACKMCKLCVRNGQGAVEYVVENTTEIDKSQWEGICVYADCQGGNIHRVTYELCGKARAWSPLPL